MTILVTGPRLGRALAPDSAVASPVTPAPAVPGSGGLDSDSGITDTRGAPSHVTGALVNSYLVK